ncbi:hypothetical protein [Hydrogenophaga sp.]|nr:hypothetical protein [Hydrogenophaga sp.]MDO9504300.1 hypothetical protein [Hydrogenophaga sp.]
MAMLHRIRNDPNIRVLVLVGSAGALCAGGNLPMLLVNVDAGPAC